MPYYQEKSLMRFPPQERQALALEDAGATVYSDGFKIAFLEYGSKGRKVLVVSDRTSEEELNDGEMGAGRSGQVLDNVLDWCVKHKRKETRLKQIALFNWQFSSVHKDRYNGINVFDIYYERLVRFIQKYKPDSVVLAGLEMYEYVYGRLTGDFATSHRSYFNRSLPVKFGDHECQLVGTIDIYRPSSWDRELTTVKSFPLLLGFLARGLLTGIEGFNHHNLRIRRKDIKFRYVNTMEKFKAFMKKLYKQDIVSIDTEGHNLTKTMNTLVSIQFAWREDEGFFIPLDHKDTPFTYKELEYIKGELCRYFEEGKSRYHIYQNAKFDISVYHTCLKLRYYNHRVYDVQAGEFGLDENRKLLSRVGIKKPYELSFIADQYGCDIYRRIELSKDKRAFIKDMDLPDPDNDNEDPGANKVVEYGCYDVIVPLKIAAAQIKEAALRRIPRFMLYVCEQLSDTALAFAQMENTGALIDLKHLEVLRDKAGPITAVLEAEEAKFKESKAVQRVNSFLLKKKGVPVTEGFWGGGAWMFSLRKVEHLQLLFFKALKLTPLGKRKDGGGKVDKKFLEKYKDVPEIAWYTAYRKLLTLRDNFVNGMIRRLARDPDAANDKRIRSYFDFKAVVTSRTSSTNPNLQNIPAHGTLAKLIKRLFIAAIGCLIVENDYSAHEIRDWANESGDKNLAASFQVGLDYRQDLRLIAYKFPDEAVAWTARKEKHNWYEIKDAAEKQKIVDKVSNKIEKKIAAAELVLEMKGDVHKNNCEIFYKVPVLEVTTKQRQDIKALVFGTVYGKTAEGLADTIGESEEYAQELQDTLFRQFPVGAGWLTQQHEFGQEHLYVQSPLGMHRHLWGYLHSRPGVVNAMNRRGPNSIIQGVASCIGVASIRIMQKLIWHLFLKQGMPFHWRSCINYVHDSVKSETKYHLIPIYLYLIEHASTTLIHRRYRKIFDYELSVGLELEFQIGASLDRSKRWNFMEDALFSQMEKEMKFQKEELGYKPDFKDIDVARHNWGVVRDIRRRELKEAIKIKGPNEIMMLTQDNSKNAGFKLLAA